jgi:acyl carrier protein
METTANPTAAFTRATVQAIVEKYLRETVEDVAPGPVDTTKSLVDLGAASLDIVEIVSCSMRELRIKVPRHELGKLQNIGQLVDLLFAVATRS